jgi:hypothetical protein
MSVRSYRCDELRAQNSRAWDRGRLARTERAARKGAVAGNYNDCAPAARCGRDARDPVFAIADCAVTIRVEQFYQTAV